MKIIAHIDGPTSNTGVKVETGHENGTVKVTVHGNFTTVRASDLIEAARRAALTRFTTDRTHRQEGTADDPS